MNKSICTMSAKEASVRIRHIMSQNNSTANHYQQKHSDSAKHCQDSCNPLYIHGLLTPAGSKTYNKADKNRQ